MAKSKAPVNGTYQHYKGGFYEALGIAEDLESGSRWVVCESLGITKNLMEGKPDEEAEYDYRVSNGVESGCGAVACGPVSTPRSSNRAGGFPAYGSRTRTHADAHAKLRPFLSSRAAPRSGAHAHIVTRRREPRSFSSLARGGITRGEMSKSSPPFEMRFAARKGCSVCRAERGSTFIDLEVLHRPALVC
jgi:hypothetical protein